MVKRGEIKKKKKPTLEPKMTTIGAKRVKMNQAANDNDMTAGQTKWNTGIVYMAVYLKLKRHKFCAQ